MCFVWLQKLNPWQKNQKNQYRFGTVGNDVVQLRSIEAPLTLADAHVLEEALFIRAHQSHALDVSLEILRACMGHLSGLGHLMNR